VLDPSLFQRRFFSVGNSATFLFSMGFFSMGFFAMIFANVQYLTGCGATRCSPPGWRSRRVR
jgi:hypothetical protein